MEVQARTKEKPTPVKVKYDFGDNGSDNPTLKGLVARFGEEVVASRAHSALVIDLQALMRRHIESKEFSLEKLQKAVAEWKPSVISTVRRSAAERVEDTVSRMTDEERAELLKKLTAQVKGGAAQGKQAQPAQAQRR